MVHRDGKLLPDISSNKEKIDRLPIIVSGQNNEQLLSVPKLKEGTNNSNLSAVLNGLNKWRIRDQVALMCLDTTASNTGI